MICLKFKQILKSQNLNRKLTKNDKIINFSLLSNDLRRPQI